MRGSIRKRGRTYGWRIDLPPDPVTGKRRQETKDGFRTKRECQADLHATLAALRSGQYVQPSNRTLRTFLLDEWLPALRPPVLRPSTWATYRTLMEAYVVPLLGNVELQRLTPAHLGSLYRTLQNGGRRRRSGALSAKTVRNTHMVLHRALKDARRWGFTTQNVAELVDPPVAERAEMTVWSPDQLRAFLHHVRHDRLFAAWLLAATTGMRRGEIVGLRWVDVDFAFGRLTVRRPRVMADSTVHVTEPKTARGRRVVALDPDTLDALQVWKAAQDREREAVGPAYNDLGLVFTELDGSAIYPRTLTDRFRRLTRAAGLPSIRLHDMRHSYASAALAAGIPPKIVSERLGHATIAVTMDTYSHVLPGLDAQAANVVARLILGRKDGKPE